MERDEKDDVPDGTSQLVRRAITWEISDSEEDNDTESKNAAAVESLSSAVQDHAEKEKLLCKSLDEAKEVASLTSLPEVASCSKSAKKGKKKCSTEKMKMGLRQTKAEENMLKAELKKERMERKEQDALEKKRRKEAAAALKSLRPDQCMKHMIVCVDPGILEDQGSDALLETLGSLECGYSIVSQTVPHSISWKRNISCNTSRTDGFLEKAEEEREVLLLLEPWDFLQRVFSLMQNMKPGGQWSIPDLSHLFPLNSLEGHSAKSYSVVVIGLDAYRWYYQHHGDHQGIQNVEPEERMEGLRLPPDPEMSVTQQHIEEALVVLQLWGNTGVLFLETWQELALHISTVTKAIAQRPYKRQRENQTFSFCTGGGWASGVRVLKDGTGLREAWSRQIQQFNRVSPAVAAAVTQAYPSPSLLLQAYRECSTDRDRQLLLSDIPVRTEENRVRRIGPDLSRRVYLLMASSNPELVLDSTA
ncbi:probable crossover junction endonuclease EME2 isoform X2 [Varanus komodoensis]|uniref:Structure-specific endonuclease subunit EME2 n=1 Tax=Varanus komodoensis TaxID=61221 RepID=A0A8D2JCM7_VARKO|nr:probable crossover junction endonuclease EME2 isoform X2 [Varanus komodoensis]